jgi:DNA-binding CsgD family transcriptional regulator
MIPPSVSVPTFNTVKSCTIRHPISHEWCSQAFSLGDTTSGRAARRQLQGRPHPSPFSIACSRACLASRMPEASPRLASARIFSGPGRQFRGTSFGDRERRDLEYARLVARYESLTSRERELLPLLASGLLNKQVAFELGITEYTVQFHRGHIMRKMRADSFAGLVRMADKLSPNDQQHLQVQFAVPS